MVENEETPAVLLVDDEESILSALKRVLRREGYRILTSNSGVDALALLDDRENAIGVVVSDFRMPDMSGVELMSHVRARHPNTIRMILSGYADAGVVQSAINHGEVYRFVSKPWDDQELKAALRAAVQQFEATRIANSVLDEVTALRREMKRLERTPTGWDRGSEPEEVRSRNCLGEGCPEVVMMRTLQSVVNALPAGLVGVDEDEVIILANPRVNHVFGMDQVSIIGNSIADVLTQEIVDLARSVADRDCERRSAVLTLCGQSVKVDCVPLGNPKEGQRRRVLISGFVSEERLAR